MALASSNPAKVDSKGKNFEQMVSLSKPKLDPISR
jgi:hypothetical protein